jgi:hypothetical protein
MLEGCVTIKKGEKSLIGLQSMTGKTASSLFRKLTVTQSQKIHGDISGGAHHILPMAVMIVGE